jgi:hypothetical protein
MENKMAITKSISANDVKNDGGTGKNIGTKSDVLSGSSLGLFAALTGSLVVEGVNTAASVVLGAFAQTNQDIVAKRVSVSLAGVSNAVLQSGASVPELTKSIHKIESIITRRLTTSIRAGHWNIFTGVFSPSPTVATDIFHKSISAAPFIDKVANASRSNPGVLVYRTGSKTPVLETYGD